MRSLYTWTVWDLRRWMSQPGMLARWRRVLARHRRRDLTIFGDLR